MSNMLFNNKYYSQLFGGKKSEEVMTPSEGSRTEDTRDRLERIFGGAPKAAKGSRKPMVAKPVMSDDEYAKTGKVQSYKGLKTADGRMIFQFKNGALAVRDPSNGRFIIIQGASADTMRELRKERGTKPKKPVSTELAQKAFSAYWNRKLREAKKFDKDNKLTGTKQSKVIAVKRSKTYSATHMRANPKYNLSPASPKGYLYLRKERVIRDAEGMPATRTDGSVRVRRAGPAIYDFKGVPEMHKGKPVKKVMSKRKTPSAKAIAAIKAHTDSKKGTASAKPRSPGRYLSDNELKGLSVDKVKGKHASQRASLKTAKAASRSQYKSKASPAPASKPSTAPASKPRSYKD